ncbi:MAG: carbohydrate kinase [Sedimenticola sp.]|nr:MAG: carbohydrate kinase [Sedimenticola sp.]
MSNPRPIIFGEVLYDHFPDGSVVLGGAPFNVAWHLQAFGASPLLISRVGNDQLGKNIQEAMTAWGMDTSGLQFDATHPTGTVDVSFTNGEPSYDIVKERAYDFIDSDGLPTMQQDSFLYHGSLALRHEVSRETLQGIRRDLAGLSFVDINLRDPWWSMELIEAILHDADMIKLNEDELLQITGHKDTDGHAVPDLLKKYNARLLILTRGKAGADVYGATGDIIHVEPETTTHVVDTVGAGDAFSSVLLYGQLLNWPIETCLRRAQHFASAIVGVRGATVSDIDFYRQFTNGWTAAI